MGAPDFSPRPLKVRRQAVLLLLGDRTWAMAFSAVSPGGGFKKPYCEWTKSISQHFETMRHHCRLVFRQELVWCAWASSPCRSVRQISYFG